MLQLGLLERRTLGSLLPCSVLLSRLPQRELCQRRSLRQHRSHRNSRMEGRTGLCKALGFRTRELLLGRFPQLVLDRKWLCPLWCHQPELQLHRSGLRKSGRTHQSRPLHQWPCLARPIAPRRNLLGQPYRSSHRRR